MTIDEMLALCLKAKKRGWGDKPIQIMLVADGVTYAEDIEAELAEKYDGERIWIHPQDNQIEPEWMQNVKGLSRAREASDTTSRK